MPRILVPCATAVLIPLASSCTASYPAPTLLVPLAAINVQYTTSTGELEVGRSFSLRVFSVDTDGVWRDVTRETSWFSSDWAVVRPLSDGAHLAVGPGQAEITGVYQGMADSITVSTRSGITPPYPHLEIFPRPDPATIGVTMQGRATLRHTAMLSEDVTAIAVWSSSDPRVVTTNAGRVTAVAPGTAEITVTYSSFTSRYGLSILPPSR